jgi:YVTN family beta-propeller protein
MPELPSGTVTLLFTDIEGSTRLLRTLRERYQEVLAEHRRLLRGAFAEHGGHEIGTEGDSFFVVFQRVKDAVAAAAQGQRALADYPWPEGAGLKVRMGLHTGEPSVAEAGYVGLGVHRAARIMAAGHGGQILLSPTTRELMIDDPPPNVGLRDLGEQRLKDFDQPEHIYQLVVPGLPSEFPPLKTLDTQPAEPTPFDEAQLAEAAAALAVGRWRLRGRRRLLAFAGALAAAGVGVGVFLLVGGSSSALSAVDANSVGVVDAKRNAIVGQAMVGASPSRVAIGAGAVWVTNFDDRTVSRVNPDTHDVQQTIQVGAGPSGVAVGNGAVWVANNLDGTLSRIDPQTNAVVQVIPVANGASAVAYGERSLWVANSGEQTVSRINPRSGTVKATIPVGASPTGLAVGGGAVWVTSESTRSVLRIDPHTNAIAQTIYVGRGPTGIAFGEGSVWAANNLDGTVSRIDPRTNAVRATINVGEGPGGVAVGGGAVWIANEFSETLSRINLRKDDVVQTIRLRNRPQGVAVSGKDVWVAVQASGAGHRGGTLRVLLGDIPVDSIDPAIASQPGSQFGLIMAYDGLAGFKRASGSEGTQLVPDLATSLPTPTDSGKTYTFEVRPNIRYSNGALVKPADFRYAIERVFKLRSQGVRYYDGIVGAQPCLRKPERCDLAAGIVTDDAARTVTFHLAAPDSEFLKKLALPYASAVPVGTPIREAGTRPVPGTGPYRVVRYKPGRRLEYARNPRFREWSRAAQPDGYPDRIVHQIGGDREQNVTAVERGKADLIADALPADRIEEVKAQYASQLHVNPVPVTFFLFLNTRTAPFDDVRVRRALNYAIDRSAIARLSPGGPGFARPTCQVLPPTVLGYRPYCPYTVNPSPSGAWTAPNLAAARRLIAASHTRGMKVTIWAGSDPARAQLARALIPLLDSLGYEARVKQVPDPLFRVTVGDSRTRAQIGASALSSLLGSSGFFAPLRCDAFRANSDANGNVAEFCKPSIDTLIERALVQQAFDVHAANQVWAKVDREIVDEAPWVPLYTLTLAELVSKRVGNFQFSPQWSTLVDLLWVR